MQFAPSTLNIISPLLHSMTPESTLSFGVVNESTAIKEKDYSFLLLHQSSFELSTKSEMTKRESMSKRRSVWHLLPFYYQENLHGIHGLHNITSSILPVTTSNSTLNM